MDNIAPTYGSRGLSIERGEGVYLFDSAGKKYLDCFSNMGVNILGHNNPDINAAITKQIGLLTNLHGSFSNSARSKFAEKLCKETSMPKMFFCNSGAEAVESAMKFARLATGRKEIIAAKMAYHGKTFGALSLTNTMKKYNEPFLPLLEHVKHFSYDDTEDLKRTISSETAAVILEPIQGEGGVRLPSQGFLSAAKKICEENGALLVIDEIQTGMGRTGKLLASQHDDVRPDMICMAKGLAGGVPAGAVLISDEISGKLFSGCHTNTFGGNPLACAAGIAVLDTIERDGLLSNAEDVGSYFLSRLQEIKSPYVREVRGRGLMIAIELKTKASDYVKALQDKGILTIPTLANVIRLLPPIIIAKEDVDLALPVFREVLTNG
ncbi:MAG: aspartate aminotransferase family protein [Nanoarchaeota archaeon]|nr:aspartate aminotransferase family protein [Nanoarchaeota archaeon]